MRKVFLDDLPRWRFGDKNPNGKISWKESVGFEVPFVYDNIKGNLKIIGYDGKNIKIQYKDKTKSISRGNFCKCNISNFLEVEDSLIETKNGYVNIENLIKSKRGIDWINSIGKIIKFKDDGIKGEIKIINYEPVKQLVTILYKHKEFKIYSHSIIKGGLSYILGKITKEYRYKIGNIIDNVEILEHIKIPNGKNVPRKGYRYKCLKCGYIGENSEAHIKDDRGICPVCCIPSRKVVKGINDISTTDPEMIKYFYYEKDVYENSMGSNKKVKMKCPNCSTEKDMMISHLKVYGYTCPQCSDGKSYGEKFMYSVLSQLKVDFEIEKKFGWSKNKRYDFFLSNINCIIETHGGQHYRNTGRGRSLEEEQKNDRLKEQLAKENGVKNYIVINTSDIKLKNIKNNIVNSKLAELFNLSKIDWFKCEEFALSNRVKEACEYKKNNPDMTTVEIGKIMKLNKNTIYKYLKIGSKINWCNYNPREEQIKAYDRFKYLGKPVEAFKNGISLGVFKSAIELERQSERLFGIKILNNIVSMVCNGHINQYGEFTFKHI